MSIPLPRRWPDTEFFWTSGADGRLRFLHCVACDHICHPPVQYCKQCGSRTLQARPVSGNATVWSFSVVHQPFVDWIEVPYILAIVELIEQPDVHLTTRLVGIDAASVHIGMQVSVTFEQHDDMYLPLFTGAGTDDR
ncbi:MAG: putative nucleic-acid-binding protein containing a Zn-ribbon [Ilumatobacteraceae bacterium]|nr:putative nucleic-acid-binding protein containing a Zn-ribbon [Ilumatobacteraceae bacterium]